MVLTSQRTSGHWRYHLGALGGGETEREREGWGWGINNDTRAFNGRKSFVKVSPSAWGPSGTVEQGHSKPRQLSWDLNPSTNSLWLYLTLGKLFIPLPLSFITGKMEVSTFTGVWGGVTKEQRVRIRTWTAITTSPRVECPTHPFLLGVLY